MSDTRRALYTRLPARASFSGAALPEARREALEAVVRAYVARNALAREWVGSLSAARQGGLLAMFTGADAAAKRQGAEAIANALGFALYRVSLAAVVGKYIGETEKNLRALFDAALLDDAILFFDEADALFGKRTAVKDAHDRYANIEVNYLLQAIESQPGIVIVTAATLKGIDSALLRRFHACIEFGDGGVPSGNRKARKTPAARKPAAAKKARSRAAPAARKGAKAVTGRKAATLR